MSEVLKTIEDENGEACISIELIKDVDDISIRTLQKAIGYLSAIHLTKDGAITMTRERGCS
jgi:hypothetical protein